jgi:hypothetical protein
MSDELTSDMIKKAVDRINAAWYTDRPPYYEVLRVVSPTPEPSTDPYEMEAE